MPDPQENSAGTPAGGIDLSGLRTRTIQQAQSELPQPQLAPPWEDEPRLQSAPTSKIGKAYQDAKQWLSDHEQHVSEKYLAPFREGLDRLGEDLQQAGESGHTPTGGALAGPTRALASGVGTLLKQVPVGRNVKETIQMSLTPPEFGPEGKALSRELKAGEKAQQWQPHDLGKEHNLPSEEGYAYHATNEERAREIAESGGMRTHKPWEHTDQNAWPDGSTEKRIYFTPQASSAWQFAPEEGKSVLLRVKQDAAKLKAEGTGDLYSQKPIHHKNVEILGDDKQWHRVSDLTNPEEKIKSANETDLGGLRTRVVSPAKAKPAPKPVEPVGIHEDDVPRRSNVPDVDWSEQDLQDSAKTVNEQTIAKDYGPKRKGAKFSVYKSHIPMEDLPSAKIAEEEDPEFQDSDWRENYQGLVRSTTPPIKVRVNPKGEMEILDGNHRAQLWSDADMTHAPAWVIDERGKGIENLSESERAERAEELEQRQQEAQQKAQKPSANPKDLPAQPRLPDTGTHAAIKTDDGGIYPDLNPEKQRTHIMLAKDLGIPPERVVSGGWLRDGEYEGSERSDAGRWGERARAQARVAEKRAADEAAQPVIVEYLHNTQKAPNLGSRFGQDIEPSGKYIIEKTPGSTTPEGWQSGKVTFKKPLIVDFGGGYQEASNWKNVLSQKYEGKTGKALSEAIRKDGFDGIITKRDGQTSEIVDLTSGKPTPQSELPARQDKAERRAGVGGYSGDSPTESQFVQKVIQGAKDTEPWAPADMGDGGKAWLDKDGKYIPQDKEHQDIAENFWNRRIRIGNLEGKGPLLIHAEGAPSEAQRKAIASDIKKQGGAIYDLKKDGNNITGEAKTVGDFLRAIDSTWKPETATKIDLSGLRVRPVKAGRQAAGMDTFIASDGRKYQFPSSDTTWEKILKVDPGAKRIK